MKAFLKAFLATFAVGAVFALWVGILAFIQQPASAPSPVQSTYQGMSATCAELQSEFNAAAARSDARHSHGLSARDDLSTMNATDSQLREKGCYR